MAKDGNTKTRVMCPSLNTNKVVYHSSEWCKEGHHVISLPASSACNDSHPANLTSKEGNDHGDTCSPPKQPWCSGPSTSKQGDGKEKHFLQ